MEKQDDWRVSMCEVFSYAFGTLNKPFSAYWFKKAALAYRYGFTPVGKLCRWIAERDLYRGDWRDFMVMYEHGRIPGTRPYRSSDQRIPGGDQ